MVQDKIDNGFEEEIPMLEQLQLLQKRLAEIPNNTTAFNEEQKEKQRNDLNQMLEELENIKLYIHLTAQLRSDMERLRKQYSE